SHVVGDRHRRHRAAGPSRHLGRRPRPRALTTSRDVPPASHARTNRACIGLHTLQVWHLPCYVPPRSSSPRAARGSVAWVGRYGGGRPAPLPLPPLPPPPPPARSPRGPAATPPPPPAARACLSMTPGTKPSRRSSAPRSTSSPAPARSTPTPAPPSSAGSGA